MRNIHIVLFNFSQVIILLKNNLLIENQLINRILRKYTKLLIWYSFIFVGQIVGQMAKATVRQTLDERRLLKDGKFPVKVRVVFNKTDKRYNTGISLSNRSF